MKSKVVEALQERLGEPIKGGSGEYRFCSPFNQHFRDPSKDDKGYHLYVNPEKMVFMCYKSGMSGSLEHLCNLLGFDISEAQDLIPVSPVLELKDRLDTIDLVKSQFLLPCADLPEYYTPVQVNSQVWNYLISRGLSDEDMIIYQLGEGTGEHDDEVIIPNFNNLGRCEYVISRSIYGKVYRNAPVPRKYHVGFLHIATWFSPKSIILTEGCFSAICAGRDAVATYGKFVSNHQLWRIKEAGVDEITIALDPDAEKEALKTAERALKMGFRTFKVTMPGDNDPADLGRDVFREYFAMREEITDISLLRKRCGSV